MIDRTGLAVLIGLLALASGLQCPKQKISPGREVVCYTSVTDVEDLTEAVCKCTTLVQQGYDARNVSTSEFESFRKSLKEIIPTLQFAISVNDPESTLRTSGMVRQEVVARLMGVFKEVDAIELNMTAGSKERLSHFVKGLRDELVRKSYDKRIFLVLPTKSEYLAKQFDLKELTKYVDLFTIPTHYLVEDDDAQRTFHPSRLMGLFDMFNADSLIDLISGLGAPKRKILISVPASAYRFTLKDQDDNAPRAPTEEMQPVVIDQRQLCDLMNKGEWTVERDEDLTAPYAFKDKTWIAFEDKISISIKGKYVLLRDLPGLAVHGIENDFKTSCAEPLTHEVHHSFSDFKRKSRAAVLNALEDDLHQRELEYTTKVKSSDFRVVRVVDTEGHIRAVRENTQTEFTCSRQGYFVHPKSCNRFYRCVKFNQEVEDYSVFEFDCPAGLSFDERTEVCVWPGSMPEGSPCPGSSEIAPVARVRFQCPSKPGYYADPQNPRWFFVCIDLGRPEIMAYEFRCPFGLIFDEQKLVCEWPWLVAGYSGGAYERPGYEFGSGTPISTGGYYTGGLPHGYTGAPGEYSGSTIGVGYTGAGSGGYPGQGVTGTGYSGAAGVGHGVSFGGQGGYTGTGASHGVSFGQGSGGYTGATRSGAAGHGVSYGGQGSGGATSSTGTGHGVSFGGQFGTGGSGYTEAAGADHGVSFGQGSGGYTGATGSGAAGHGVSYGGQGSSGATSSTGTGHGVSFGGQFGTGGSGYTGTAGADHGVLFGQGSGGYTGATGSGAAGHGVSYGGQGSSGATSSTGTGHGVSFGGQFGTGGSGYTGTAGADHGVLFGQGSGGYTGATGSGAAGHGVSYGGQGSGGATSSTGTGHGVSFGGQFGTGGSGYTGTAGVDHGVSFSGAAGTGYTQTIGHEGSFGGQGAGGYTGSFGSGTTGRGYSESGKGQTGTGYSGGSTSGVYKESGTGYSSGTTYQGAGGGYSKPGETGSTYAPGYSSSVGGGYSGSTQGVYSGSIGGGYTGTTSTVHGGSSGGYSGSIGGGYSGIPSSVHGGSSGGYSGSVGGGYSGTTSSIHGGSSGGYSGSIGGGYSGIPSSVHDGSSVGYSGSVGGGYSGTTSSIHGGSSGGYSGSVGGGYSGTTSSIHGGSSGGYSGSVGGGYSGTTSSIHGGSTGGYSGSVGGGYSGTTSSAHAGAAGDGYSGSGGYSGASYGSTILGGDYSGIGSGVTSHGYSGETGTKYTGSSFGIGTGQPARTPIYVSSGPTGTGIGVTSVHTQTPGPVLIDKPDQPICITSCYPQPSGGQTYKTDGYVSSGVTSGTNVYQGGYTGSRNVSFGGSYIPSVGTTYHGGVTPSGYAGSGTIITGQNVQGSIITGDSTPGTLITYGQSPGAVFGGSTDQGSVITGGSRPGYVKTSPGSPGYVVSEGVKTVYSGSATPGTVLYGTPSPGVAVTASPGSGTIIKGQPSPGIVLTGHTAPGVSLGGTVEQGTIIGSTGHVYPGTQHDIISGSPFGIRTTTASYDSGYRTNEYHDNGGRGTIKFNNGDVTTKYTENDLPDYRPAGGTIPPDRLIPGSKGLPSTPTGFSKTGLTQSGVTSGTLAAGGSYVIGTGRSRPTPKPDRIGANAFEGNVVGYTKSSTESSVSSTYNQDINRVDTSKIDLGTKGPGYSYPTPSIPFQTGTRVSSTESSIFGSTTPTPFLNVELYNTPTVASRPTGFTRAPFYTSGGTTLDDYRTTIFEAAKIPISTVRPIDTVFKTTAIPEIQYGGVQTGSQFGFGDRGYSSTTPASIPAATPTPRYEYRPTVGPSGSGYFSSTSKSVFGENVTPSGVSDSLGPQKTYGYTVHSGTSGYSTSSRDETGKFDTGYNRGTTKYVPSEYDVYDGSISGGDYSRTQQGYSSTISGFDYSNTRQGYGSTTPASIRTQSPFSVTTYSGGYSKPSSVITYQTTAKSTAVGKGKVIVKWSDLHPLLLGKLGAECTCRGDPFANLRGPGSKLINSSKGKVDLATYDESDIYVDLEKENSYEEGDYSSREYEGPVKIWNNQIPKIPSSQVQEKPSSTYLPSVTPSAGLAARAGLSSRGLTANFRAGKSLNSFGTANSFDTVGNKNSPVVQPAFGESEEVIDGVTNCARPGLFRHPNFCNKFYACHWDEWKKKFTLHVFNCPVHLTFDNGQSACNWPSMGPACQDDNLLV